MAKLENLTKRELSQKISHLRDCLNTLIDEVGKAPLRLKIISDGERFAVVRRGRTLDHQDDFRNKWECCTLSEYYLGLPIPGGNPMYFRSKRKALKWISEKYGEAGEARLLPRPWGEV